LLRLSPHNFVRLPPLLPQQFFRLRSCAANFQLSSNFFQHEFQRQFFFS
jgi:hypothetical protein